MMTSNEYKQLEWWTNEYSVRIMKRCVSCAHCMREEGMESETCQSRYCMPHKIAGKWTKAKVVDRSDLACAEWKPKKGLLKVGNGVGHPLRKIDVVAFLHRLGVDEHRDDSETTAKPVTNENIKKRMEKNLEKVEQKAIRKAEKEEANECK